MATLTEGLHEAEYLLSEQGNISRDEVIVTLAGTALVSGTVLGKVTASGKYRPYNSGNSDGSQTAAAVLKTPLPAVTGDRKAVIHARLCEVDKTLIAPTNATVIGQLAAAYIIAR